MSDDDGNGEVIRGAVRLGIGELEEFLKRFTWRDEEGVLHMDWAAAERAQAEADRSGDEPIQ